MIENELLENLERSTENPDTDVVIDLVKDDIDFLSFCLFNKYRNYQFHYNKIKTQYKYLSLTWIGGAFMGFTYLITGRENALPFDLDFLVGISLVAFFANIGILLLCFLDTAVYHRLIEVIFKSCLHLEKEFPFLKKTHQNMSALLNNSKITSPVFYDGCYYMTFSSIFLLIANTCLCLHFFRSNGWSLGFFFFIWGSGLGLIALFECYLMILINKSSFKRLFLKRTP